MSRIRNIAIYIAFTLLLDDFQLTGKWHYYSVILNLLFLVFCCLKFLKAFYPPSPHSLPLQWRILIVSLTTLTGTVIFPTCFLFEQPCNLISHLFTDTIIISLVRLELFFVLNVKRHVVDCRTGGKAKTLKVAKDALSSGKSVVVDNTHRSVTVTL